MTRVAQGQRKRAYRPKTRTGCHTCKLRRVKCDEAKPSCYSCTSTGRKCDGYGPNMEVPPELSSTVLGALSRSPFIGFLGTETERQSFYFFRQKTAPQLSGFLGGDFWETLLLQAALHEPSIRHAILALGSLHANFEQDNSLVVQSHTNEWTDDFALKHYSQAINILVEPLSQGSQRAIDTMQGSYGSAITHAQSGMKILCEVKYNEETCRHQHDVLEVSEVPYISIEMLQEMFVRLDLQVTQMVSGQEWKTYDSMNKYAQRQEIPAIFSNLSKARELLVSHWHVASYSTSDGGDSMSEKFPAAPEAGAWEKKSMSILARWSSAYHVYLNIRGDNLTDIKRKGTAALGILKELGSTAMMLIRTMVDDQRNWDVFCPMFQKIVSLAEDIVELDLKSTVERVERHPFCIDMALVRPLFEVSCRCRDPVIRRRAISILQKCGRIEGVWNAFSASKIAQRVLDIEEAGLQNVRSCEDVPGWARISNVSTVFDPIEQRATLTYSGPGSEHDLTRQTVEEVIEW
ncbi:hypothetical protein N431DRAFT_336663 [Stipitochalara longipes BDJ]|nr:hypothetical protein N431DRAFT_336663 [Stipitochalara longipes BDJ]